MIHNCSLCKSELSLSFSLPFSAGLLEPGLMLCWHCLPLDTRLFRLLFIRALLKFIFSARNEQSFNTDRCRIAKKKLFTFDNNLLDCSCFSFL